jgi:hypothetical protein
MNPRTARAPVPAVLPFLEPKNVFIVPPPSEKISVIYQESPVQTKLLGFGKAL